MKVTKFSILFLAIVSIAVAGGCSQTQSSNVNATTQAVATPEPTPDKDAIVAEITRMEKDWPRILKEKDGAAVRRMEADDVILLNFIGMLGSKEQDIKDIEAGNLTFDSWDISEINVKVIDHDAAVASLLMTIKNAKYKDGSNSEDISGHYRALDTFARRNGQWQVVASTVVKLTRDAEQALAATTAPNPAPATSPTIKSSPVVKPAATRRPPPSSPPTNQ
jgi:ketosteroid isomerase-like protein